MRRKTKSLKYFLPLFLILLINPVFAKEIDLNSQNAVLYNLNDNRIIYEKNKDEKVSIASLTKLMTALVVIENINDINQKVSFIKSDYDMLVKQNASASSLNMNKKYSYLDLLYGLILESGADCANALARLTFKNENNFVKEMNKKANELGMTNTKFSNPIGLDSINNYSTVNDIAILLKEALKNPVLNKIINTFHYTLSDNTKINHTIYYYTNAYKINMPYLKGGKTGYESKSGYALASIANKNKTSLILVTSKAKNKPNHIIDAKIAYEYFFNNYDNMPIIEKGTNIVTLNTKHLNKNKITIKLDKDILYYLNKNYSKNDIKTVYEGKKTISLKDRFRSRIGTLKIYYKDKKILNYPVILNEKTFPSYTVLIEILALLLTSIVIYEKFKAK